MLILAMLVLGLTPPSAACSPVVKDYAHKSELPDGVRALLKWPMADVGEPINMSDVLDGDIPQSRFISAHRDQCKLALTNLQGGLHASVQVVIFDLGPAGWTTEVPSRPLDPDHAAAVR